MAATQEHLSGMPLVLLKKKNSSAYGTVYYLNRDALSKLFTREGGAAADGAILPYVGDLQLISTLKIDADCCQLCQYKLTKPNLTKPREKQIILK